MTQHTPLAQAALLKWVNTFETRRKAVTLQELRDGIILGQVLEKMLAPEFQSSSLLSNPQSDADKKQNLETVYRGLARFLRSDNPLLAPSPSEFRAIAENPDDNAMCEFLSAFLTAACLGSLSRTYVPNVMTLDKATQGEIAKIINHKSQLKEERESKETAEGQSFDNDMDLQAARDPDLMQEEMDQWKEKVDILRKQNADLQTRLDKLLDTRESVLQDLRNSQDELSSLKKARGSDASAAIRDMRNELRDKMAEIDRLEDLFHKEKMTSGKLQRENEALRTTALLAQELQDRVTLLEHETRQQQQTIKGLENYKKKAQDSTAIQQRNRVLDAQVQQLEQEVKFLEDVREQNRRLQKEVDEKVRVLSSNEQEIIYTLESKNALQDANEDLKRKVEYLESKRQLDESTIRDLQEQLQLGDVFPTGSESPNGRNFNLEQELETSSSTSDPAVTLRLEVQRLKAENNLLRNNMAVASENERLRSELESANQKVDHYRLQATESMEQHAVAQEQINALVTNSIGEGDNAFVNMRRNLLEVTRDCEALRKRTQELERENSDKERQVLQLKADMEAVGEEQSVALAALKSSDELISDSLRTELEATRRQLNSKTFELEQMKEQLMGALVSKDKTQKKLDDALAAVANSVSPPDGSTKSRKEDAEKIEKLKAALRQKIEQLEKSEHDKYDFQRRLKLMENGGAFAAQKAANEQIIKTLQRENAMITTAWYDLTSRLQSNHVVLARRHDAPKSWLNKQRQMVNSTPRR